MPIRMPDDLHYMTFLTKRLRMRITVYHMQISQPTKKSGRAVYSDFWVFLLVLLTRVTSILLRFCGFWYSKSILPTAKWLIYGSDGRIILRKIKSISNIHLCRYKQMNTNDQKELNWWPVHCMKVELYKAVLTVVAYMPQWKYSDCFV